MTLRAKLELGGAVIMLALLAVLVAAWHGAHDDALKMEATIKAQREVMAEADKRQADRDAALKVSLSQLEDAKKRTQTPQEAVRALPSVIPLPQPIYLAPRPNPPQGSGNAAATGTSPAIPDAVIPAADLKPLYDFGIACQECKAKLATAEADRADDQVKLAALGKERDAAVTAAKGGRKWDRIKRAGKWFIIGAVAGAVAAKTAH